MATASPSEMGAHADIHRPFVARLTVLILALATTLVVFVCTAESQDETEAERRSAPEDSEDSVPTEQGTMETVNLSGRDANCI